MKKLCKGSSVFDSACMDCDRCINETAEKPEPWWTR